MQQVQVVITLPTKGAEAGPAAQWFDSFQSWLEVTPRGVAVELYYEQKLAYVSEYVGIDEVKDYFRSRLPGSRVSYNARMVFYWLIKNLHTDLEVRCAACRERYGKCQCKASGYRKFGDGPGEWHYGDLTPDYSTNEGVWVIGRRSLVKLPPLRLDQVSDVSTVRRERVRQFLQFMRGE